MSQKEVNFEEAMKKLEEIANELEKGELNLDESVNKFEEGMKLSKKCNDFLDEAEKKITMLVNNNGKIEEENFIPEED
jgi:exodeoxyribonuclease VII small subunit